MQAKKKWILAMLLLMLQCQAFEDGDDDVFDAIPTQFEGLSTSAYIESVAGHSLSIVDQNAKKLEWRVGPVYAVGVSARYGFKNDFYVKDAYVALEAGILDTELKHFDAAESELALQRRFALYIGGGAGLMPNPAAVMKLQGAVYYAADQLNYMQNSVDLNRKGLAVGISMLTGINEAVIVDIGLGASLDISSDGEASINVSVLNSALGGVSQVSSSGIGSYAHIGVSYKA
jgi:hypothetical protein